MIRLASGTEAPKPRTPTESLVLAMVAMIPVALGAASAVVGRPGDRPVVTKLTIGWSGAILCFLSGVRRGLAFRQPGGPTARQLGEMLGIFSLGAGALLSPSRRLALVALAAGYASLGVLDPEAAEAGQAPRFFGRLRPFQMAVPVVSLIALLTRTRGETRAEPSAM